MENLFGSDPLVRLLSYSPEEPLLFTSGAFLFIFCAFLTVYYLLRGQRRLRILYTVLFSLFFYYKTGGWYLLILAGMSLSDYLIGHAIGRTASRTRRRALVALSVCLDLTVLGYFKYTGFLGQIFAQLWNYPFDFGNIFLPVGISFFTFQSISYTIDIYRGQVTPVRRWIDYLFYLSFFPQLVAGPIVRAKDFLPQIDRNPVRVSREMLGTGIFLILIGLVKKAIVSDYISLNYIDRIFDTPALYSGFENLMGVYGYALQIYCDFSGYSDMAIGIALLLGFHFNKNFDAPYKSATITEFWHRWHISLSTWLKDYLYIPLGGNRKGRVRTYVNLMLTMLLGGLWHGAAWRFIGWGALHGAALAAHKLSLSLFPRLKPTGDKMKRGWRIAGILLTFHIVCLGWVFFRAPDFGTGITILERIFTDLNPAAVGQVLDGYRPVFALLLAGYLFHFLPGRLNEWAHRWVIRLPAWAQVLLLVVVIWGVLQTRSAEIQPFIYFQF